MASSRKKRSRAVVTLLLCLAAVCIVAALVLYGLANRKLKALQQGADFEFTYAVTSQGGTTHPALYSILDQAGATEGRMTGLYSPGQLQLYLYSRDAATTETSGDNFFTDVYIDADQTLFNAGKLYRTLRDSVVSSYPLVGTFFPEWSLPNYVSQAQLAQMLGGHQSFSGHLSGRLGQTQGQKAVAAVLRLLHGGQNRRGSAGVRTEAHHFIGQYFYILICIPGQHRGHRRGVPISGTPLPSVIGRIGSTVAGQIYAVRHQPPLQRRMIQHKTCINLCDDYLVTRDPPPGAKSGGTHHLPRPGAKVAGQVPIRL